VPGHSRCVRVRPRRAVIMTGRQSPPPISVPGWPVRLRSSASRSPSRRSLGRSSRRSPTPDQSVDGISALGTLYEHEGASRVRPATHVASGRSVSRAVDRSHVDVVLETVERRHGQPRGPRCRPHFARRRVGEVCTSGSVRRSVDEVVDVVEGGCGPGRRRMSKVGCRPVSTGCAGHRHRRLRRRDRVSVNSHPGVSPRTASRSDATKPR